MAGRCASPDDQAEGGHPSSALPTAAATREGVGKQEAAGGYGIEEVGATDRLLCEGAGERSITEGGGTNRPPFLVGLAWRAFVGQIGAADDNGWFVHPTL